MNQLKSFKIQKHKLPTSKTYFREDLYVCVIQRKHVTMAGLPNILCLVSNNCTACGRIGGAQGVEFLQSLIEVKFRKELRHLYVVSNIVITFLHLYKAKTQIFCSTTSLICFETDIMKYLNFCLYYTALSQCPTFNNYKAKL